MDDLSLKDRPMELVDTLRLVLENLLSILSCFRLSAASDNHMIAVVLDRLVGVVDLQFRDAVVGEVVGELVRQRFAHGVYDRDGDGLGHCADECGIEESVADGGLSEISDGLPVTLPVVLLVGNGSAFDGIHHADGWDVLDSRVEDVLDVGEKLLEQSDEVSSSDINGIYIPTCL